MKNTKVIAAFIAVVIISLLGAAGVYIYSLNSKTTNESSATREIVPEESGDLFTELEAEYTAMEGEEYDKAFITEMIAHHQGAVSMAYIALSNAKHAELKTMAQNIVDSQMAEIRNMEQWKNDWGYVATGQSESGGMAGMDHGSGDMEKEMMAMTNELNSKNGDEFDKAFLELMIEHHKSAIAMARPGAKNAQHQEVKDLAAAIVSAQNSEITQMQQWQQDGGYRD